MQGIEGYNYCNSVLEVTAWGYCHSEPFAKVLYFHKYLHYWFIVFFRLVDLRIVKKLLENRVDNSLTNLSAYTFQFILYIFGVIKVYDVEGYLVVDAFGDDMLYNTYSYIVFFHLFYP